jgi:hypothetical protein
VLGRKPLELEVAKRYRADPEEVRQLRTQSWSRLASSPHVITARIQERLPSMPAFEYELLDKILPSLIFVATPIGVCIDALTA